MQDQPTPPVEPAPEQSPSIPIESQDASSKPAKTHTKYGSTDVLMGVAALIVAIMGGGLLLMWMRRRLFTQESAHSGASGLMDDLRRMRDSGQLSQLEYDTIRKKMAARLAKAPAPAPKRPTSE